MDYPMGSIWRKWDFHIHSPLSLLNNQFRNCMTVAPTGKRMPYAYRNWM